MSSQKSVRFSPKGDRKSKKGERPASARSDKKSSKGESNDLDDSPVNSLTTNVASPPQSVENFVLPLAGPEPEGTHLAYFDVKLPFVPTTGPDTESCCPDKPNLYDSGNKDIPPPSAPEPAISYIQTISYPLDRVVRASDPKSPKALLREHPPELVELIQQLEIEHFGKDIRELDIDNMFSVRNEDELRDLTERLHSYISKIRDLRTGAVGVDARSFFKSVEAMETEMTTFKNTYEREINKLRQQLADLSREKSHLQLQNSKLEATASELQNRMTSENERSQRIKEEMSLSQQTLIQKEQELNTRLQQSLTDMSKAPDFSETNKKLDETLRENLDLHHRYETELLLRKENEEKVHQLEQQISFGEELSQQRQADLQERLAAANTAILTLESKIYAAHQVDQEKTLSDMLSTVRDTAEMELTKYKRDVEETYSTNMGVLKSQMMADKKSIDAVSDENRKLTNVIEELKVNIQNLQAEIMRAQHAKSSVEERIQMERERATKYIQTMEVKVKDLQDGLFDKMKELNTARIQVLPLKAEVESLRALIEEEEHRLASEIKYAPLTTPIPAPVSGLVTVAPGLDSFDAGLLSSSECVTRTVQVEPAARIDLNLPASTDQNNKPIGPIVPKSAQLQQDVLNLETNKETHGQTEILTNGGCATTGASLPRPESVRSHDYNHCTNSATGNLRIHEVHPEGRSIILINMSSDKVVDFGGFVLQQQVGGHTAAMYRFPPKTPFPPKSYITVFSGCNDSILHQPPTQFVWKEQERWGTGPECTTLLCQPNGQAIAWSTAAHRFRLDTSRTQSPSAPPEELSCYANNPQALPTEPIYLKREKEAPPTLAAQRHPHGNSQVGIHPDFNEGRTMDLGNDNSSNHRQSRSQSGKPDKVPGEPYSGPCGQRMGSSTMRRYTPLNSAGSGNVRKNGMIANRIDPGELSDNPSPFMTPRSKHASGLQQIQSQHQQQFNPPMPRPPMFSSW